MAICDEVYYKENFKNFEFTSLGPLGSEMQVPVICVGGLEKTFCVPGWSISWVLFFDNKYNQLAEIKKAV